MYTKTFWKDAAERAVKTFAQALVALLVAAGVTSVVALNWPVLLGTAALSAVISFLTSLAGPAVADSTVSPASFVEDDGGLS